MKLAQMIAAAGLAVAALGMSVSAGADRYHHDRWHGRGGWHGHRGGWHGHRRCRTEWHHHHRVTRCY